jgi:signal transduction histidine kinase
MKRWQFTILLVIGIACFCLTLVCIVFARQNQKLQAEVQAQQIVINKGTLSKQIGVNLLREMANVAQTDDQMKQLLQKNGYSLSTNPSASSEP